MSFSFFKHQLAAVIEWPNQQPGVLLYKYQSANNEIKNASKLIAGPGQGAMLVYEGVVTDVLETSGIYDLETDNHPFITTLTRLRTGFESEHKLMIYFYRTAENVNLPWGTAAPVKYIDPVYKLPVELGANGNFSFRITDAKLFFTEVAGLKDLYLTAEAKMLLQSRMPQAIAALLAAAQFSYQQIDAQLMQLSDSLEKALSPVFAQTGCTLTDFRLNGTAFDKATQSRIGAIADITAESQAAAAGGLDYTGLEKLKALRDAARNTGGLAGAGLQMGAGIELGKAFATQKDNAAAAPENTDPVAHLQKLKLLLNEGIITQAELIQRKRNGWISCNR